MRQEEWKLPPQKEVLPVEFASIGQDTYVCKDVDELASVKMALGFNPISGPTPNSLL